MELPPAESGLSSRCFLLRGSLSFPQNQTAQAGAIHPFLPCHSPSRRCNTGITAWSPCWRMLGGNHGNGQVSLSLPLPITLRCHHVLATNRAPRVPSMQLSLSCPGVCGSRTQCWGSPLWPKDGIQASSTTQGSPHCGGGRRRDPRPVPPPCPRAGSVPSRRKEPGEALPATSASAYPCSRPGPSRNSSPGWLPMPALM